MPSSHYPSCSEDDNDDDVQQSSSSEGDIRGRSPSHRSTAARIFQARSRSRGRESETQTTDDEDEEQVMHDRPNSFQRHSRKLLASLKTRTRRSRSDKGEQESGGSESSAEEDSEEPAQRRRGSSFGAAIARNMNFIRRGGSPVRSVAEIIPRTPERHPRAQEEVDGFNNLQYEIQLRLAKEQQKAHGSHVIRDGERFEPVYESQERWRERIDKNVRRWFREEGKEEVRRRSESENTVKERKKQQLLQTTPLIVQQGLVGPADDPYEVARERRATEARRLKLQGGTLLEVKKPCEDHQSSSIQLSTRNKSPKSSNQRSNSAPSSSFPPSPHPPPIKPLPALPVVARPPHPSTPPPTGIRRHSHLTPSPPLRSPAVVDHRLSKQLDTVAFVKQLSQQDNSVRPVMCTEIEAMEVVFVSCHFRQFHEFRCVQPKELFVSHCPLLDREETSLDQQTYGVRNLYIITKLKKTELVRRAHVALWKFQTWVKKGAIGLVSDEQLQRKSARHVTPEEALKENKYRMSRVSSHLEENIFELVLKAGFAEKYFLDPAREHFDSTKAFELEHTHVDDYYKLCEEVQAKFALWREHDCYLDFAMCYTLISSKLVELMIEAGVSPYEGVLLRKNNPEEARRVLRLVMGMPEKQEKQEKEKGKDVLRRRSLKAVLGRGTL
ncbi:hypothetical protein T439DRAFT_369858 [Meredithblackwellia eburnea MCA 4105]